MITICHDVLYVEWCDGTTCGRKVVLSMNFIRHWANKGPHGCVVGLVLLSLGLYVGHFVNWPSFQASQEKVNTEPLERCINEDQDHALPKETIGWTPSAIFWACAFPGQHFSNNPKNEASCAVCDVTIPLAARQPRLPVYELSQRLRSLSDVLYNGSVVRKVQFA